MKTTPFFSAMTLAFFLAACSANVFDSAEDLGDSPNGISPSFAAAAPSPSKSPGGHFPALAYFKLTLPTGSTGNPDEIQPSVLKGSYQKSPYFYTGSDGAMVFWCPVNGVHQTKPIDATWKTQDLYFKAGLYCLDGGTSSTDGGEAYFYSLSQYHGG